MLNMRRDDGRARGSAIQDKVNGDEKVNTSSVAIHFRVQWIGIRIGEMQINFFRSL